ncbi:MAG: polyketide synthase module [Nitrospira sp.]|jgi:amino acid adenylation domain-containing protein|nr:MAG: polyketide synthase module [Nitrospira sp.]
MTETQTKQASANIEDIYPLSPMQEGLLFHTLLEPGSGMYLMQDRYGWDGPLDVAAFRQAWQQVMDRHGVLRTAFVWERQKRPLQVVHKQVAVPLEYLDWRDRSAAAQAQGVEEVLAQELATGFDLGKVPLLRLRLIRTGATTYRITRSYHLILMDAWCFSVLMVDFFRFYEALVAGRPLAVPKPRPYREYIAWLQQQDMQEAEGFWREQLRGFTVPTPVGVLRDRPAEWRGPDPVADAVVTLSEETTAALQAWATRHRVTLNTLVQGAWAWLLSRYSGETEVVFGVTVAGRPPGLAGVEDMVGLFINSLPLRVTVAGDRDVVSWLQELFAQNLRLRQYEYAPLVQIQSWSEVPRGRALFDSLLVFENLPVDSSLTNQNLPFRVCQEGDRTHTNYPLTVVIVPLKALELQLTYDRRQCEEATIRRMLAQFQGVLEQLVAGPGRRLGEVTVLSAAEVREQTRTWNETGAAYPAEQSVAELFEAQVARTPAAVAVQGGAEALTYAELDARAAQVAGGLVAAGVGPDTVVAVLAARGVEWVTLLLGILKAGGGYLPLDPTHPPARWGQLLTQGHVRQVLTTEAERHRLEPLVAERPDLRVATRASLPAGRYPRPPRRTHPQQVGYVLFTSGSTGQPKGAVVSQQGMVNNVWGKLPVLGLTSRDVVAQTAGVGFDISVWQGLSALLCGGRVEILSDDVVQEPVRLLAEFARTGVTVAELVPSLLREVVAVEPAPALPALRWLLPTGEAVTPELCRAWLTRYPTVPLLNAYGPAECADDVAYYPLTRAPGAEETVVPIGRPAANLELYVLNADLAPVPVGVTGELWIGGVGVGRGYLGEPGRTAAAFGPHPFSEQPGQRLYRTGDLGRYRADGTLEFLGRRDQQVKVRGVRIELGEIEARLREHPAIGQAVVVARAEPAGSKRLVGYLVTTAPVAVAAVREFLGRRLPEYMVPAVYVVLDKLPLTPNGKVDRKALPAPEAGDLPRPVAYAPPATPTEARLATIWAELLGVAQVGRHDNFFELGGHSLLAVQLMSRVRKHFRTELALRDLFEASTVAGLADLIEESLTRQLEVLSESEAERLLADESPVL